MYLDRNLVAKLLETRPHNIKSLKQVESKIYIQLDDVPEELFMTLEEYQNCHRQLKSTSGQIDRSSFVTIMVIISTFIFATISAIDTRLANHTSLQTTVNSSTELSTRK